MSVLCCHIPDFLFAVTRRREPELERAERPVALLGSDQTVWAISPPARAEGICAGMSPRQARARCPDVCLRPLDTAACEAEHHALLGVMAHTGLPTEAQDWGAVYVDLRPVTTGMNDAQRLCADLGRQVRRELGEALQPALGWDSSKFTSRAAAHTSPLGRSAARRRGKTLGPTTMRQEAVAWRRVTGLSPTSTICRAPVLSRWVNSLMGGHP